MTEMEQPLVTIAQHSLFLPEAERSVDAAARASKRFKTVASVLDERMKGRDFILGNAFSAADVVLGGVLYFAKRMNQISDDMPTLSAYLNSLLQRPARKKGYSE